MRRHPGRTPILEREPELEEALDRLVDPVTRGDPESPLRWTSKSGAKLAEALREMGQVYAQLDDREYEKGIKVSDAQLATINITRNTFHGDWNYAVAPSHAQS